MTPLITLVTVLFYVMELAIVARVLLSWLGMSPDHPVARLLIQTTEPLLGFLRGHLPTVGMFDISPVVAILLLDVIRRLLVALLSSARL